MLDSIRVRLTLWYTLVLGLVLVLLAAFTYLVYWRNVTESTVSSLTELANGFATTFQAELADASETNSVRGAARVAIVEHHFRDTVFVVLNSSNRILLSSFDIPTTDTAKEHLNPEFLQSTSFRQFVENAATSSGALGKIQTGRKGFRGMA